MKALKMIGVLVFLLASVQNGQAQIFKKLKEKLKGEKTNVPTEMMSSHDMKFKDWNLGKSEIVAISVFSDDFEKHRQKVGTIGPDGNFNLNLPDSQKTWMPVSVYGKSCENSGEAKIKNPEVKLAWNQMHVFQDEEYLGAISPANPVKAAYNVNQSGVNNGKLGKYYLWVYADGDASATIDCKKRKDITDGNDYTYKNFLLKDNFNLHYKKGWNIVEVHNLDNFWVGLTKHYVERSWKVVDEMPRDAIWVFRPRINED